jgi:hypothetical protein
MRVRSAAFLNLAFSSLFACHGGEPAAPASAPPPTASSSEGAPLAEPPPTASATSSSTSSSNEGARVSIGKLFESPPNWDIRGFFDQNKAKLEDCWAQVLKAQPHERGKLSIRFIVSSEGKVTKTEEVSSTFRDANLSQCVQRAIASLPWQPPGGTATIVLPLVFRP